MEKPDAYNANNTKRSEWKSRVCLDVELTSEAFAAIKDADLCRLPTSEEQPDEICITVPFMLNKYMYIQCTCAI